jgi:DNA-binding GntR family transcriptional regulator
MFAPIERTERITDAVYERLRDAIFAGDLRAGSRLSVPALAELLGVSRSPVREAVVRLTQERLAREEPRRGAMVARVDSDELASVYEVREVLEGLAARLAVLHGGAALVTELDGLFAAHESAVESNQLADHVKLDMGFHQAIRRGAGNPELIRLLDEIQTRVRLAMLTTTETSGPALALKDHREILEAIRKGDPDEAERRAREHVGRLRDTLRGKASASAGSRSTR